MLAMDPDYGLQTIECLVLVVQRLDSAIYRINHNPLDKYYSTNTLE